MKIANTFRGALSVARKAVGQLDILKKSENMPEEIFRRITIAKIIVTEPISLKKFEEKLDSST